MKLLHVKSSGHCELGFLPNEAIPQVLIFDCKENVISLKVQEIASGTNPRNDLQIIITNKPI